MPESNSQHLIPTLDAGGNCELSYKDNAWKQFTTDNERIAMNTYCELSYKDNAWKQFTTTV